MDYRGRQLSPPVAAPSGPLSVAFDHSCYEYCNPITSVQGSHNSHGNQFVSCPISQPLEPTERVYICWFHFLGHGHCLTLLHLSLYCFPQQLVYTRHLLFWPVNDMNKRFQLSARHLCRHSTWADLIVNTTVFSLLSQITVLSSEFHEERPSAQTDLTRWLWDDAEASLGRAQSQDPVKLQISKFRDDGVLESGPEVFI